MTITDSPFDQDSDFDDLTALGKRYLDLVALVVDLAAVDPWQPLPLGGAQCFFCSHSRSVLMGLHPMVGLHNTPCVWHEAHRIRDRA